VKTLQVRDAKASFSALVEAAERGEPTTITRHGKPAAVVVPVDAARKLYPEGKPNFGAFLLGYPGGVELERDQTPLGDVDL
jgi:prevent-host-death family protein